MHIFGRASEKGGVGSRPNFGLLPYRPAKKNNKTKKVDCQIKAVTRKGGDLALSGFIFRLASENMH